MRIDSMGKKDGRETETVRPQSNLVLLFFRSGIFKEIHSKEMHTEI